MAAVKGNGAQLAFATAVELQHDSDVQLSSREESFDENAVKRLHHKPTIPRTLNHLIGLIGVNSSVVSAWPIFFLTSVLSLSNGGTAGYLVGVLIASIGLIPVYISLAEKIRKYPTSGGQYHWVAALAPPKIRRGLSFYCGFVLAFTWMTFLAANVWLGSLSIAAVVLIYTGEYDVKWAFLIAVCMQLLSLAINVTWGKHMNTVETISVVLHLVTLLLLVGLLVFARATNTVSTSFVFSTDTGWSVNMGIALDVVYAATTLSGFDCASHLAEDTVNPSKRVPKSLLWTISLNMIACITCAVLVGLAAGNVGDLFGGSFGLSGHPFGAIIQMISNAARGRKDLASAPFGLFASILMICSINATAAASRMAFSLIRDDRNPAVYRLMSTDLERQTVPRITIVLTALSPLLTLWINFYSGVGFQAIGSQCILSLSSTYLMAIGCSLHSRFRRPELLGRTYNGIFHPGVIWGTFIDATALCFLCFVWVFSWFPVTAPINTESINYAPIIWVGISIVAMVYYFANARLHYRNPAPEDDDSI
ncbi:hypothetical protein KC333_g5677 [Hortaea werneckii]|nr:hypothetical protein KC333_g5677 [Hortaea werneckii]KAI7311676.1 hypothetical protein KC326_g6180 [Hortaea werneckii]